MTPWEKVRRESVEMPRVRLASPLPWLLLAVSIALGLTTLVVSRSRLSEQRDRMAAALKANDDLNAKIKATEGKVQNAQALCSEAENAKAELSKRIVTLELQNRRLQDDLAKARAATKK